MTWRDVAPFSSAPKDRWLRLNWAAKHFSVNRGTLLGWAKDGTIEAKQSPTGQNWYVSELSLKRKLFGET